jgi:hypothetical protein
MPPFFSTSRLLLGLAWLAVLAGPGAACADESPFRDVTCEGTYPKHLQGVCTDGERAFFWSFTDRLVKTDLSGKILKQIRVGDHHGDLCYHGGRVYVAVNFGKFNEPEGAADSWVYVYDAETLGELARHRIPEVVHGAGGIAYHGGRFLVVGGLPNGVKENYAYEYDERFGFRRRHALPGGTTLMGIQTAEFADGRWWFGCYGNPKILLVADEALGAVERYEFDASLGIIGLGDGRFLVARGPCQAGAGCSGALIRARPTPAGGLGLVRP